MSDHPHPTESDDVPFNAAAVMTAAIRAEGRLVTDDDGPFDPAAAIRRARGA